MPLDFVDGRLVPWFISKPEFLLVFLRLFARRQLLALDLPEPAPDQGADPAPPPEKEKPGRCKRTAAARNAVASEASAKGTSSRLARLVLEWKALF